MNDVALIGPILIKGLYLDIWDESLVDEIKQQSKQAFARCYRFISPQIYTTIFKICRNQDTAQKLLHNTFDEGVDYI